MKNLILNLHDFWFVFASVESIFISFILIQTAGKMRQSRIFLALTILFFGGTLLSNVFMWGDAFQNFRFREWLIIPLVYSACVMLQGPAIYLYLKSLTVKIDLKSPFYYLHLLPFCLISSVIVIFHLDTLHFLPKDEPQGSIKYIADSIWVILKCAPIFYTVSCFIYKHQFRRETQKQYSPRLDYENNLALVVLIGFSVYWLWSAAFQIIYPFFTLTALDVIGIVNNYFGVLFINLIIAFCFLNAQQTFTPIFKSKKSVDKEIYQSLINRIEDAVSIQKVYLDSGLNQVRFSKIVEGTTKQTSFVINHHYKTNFLEFINGYRIEEAKALLRSDEHKNKTILDISQMAGFNSLPTFNRFFKRLEGMTPREYRKLQIATKNDKGS